MKTYHVRQSLALDGKTYRLGAVLPLSAFDGLSDEEKREHERRCVVVDEPDAPSAVPTVINASPLLAAKE